MQIAEFQYRWQFFQGLPNPAILAPQETVPPVVAKNFSSDLDSSANQDQRINE